MTDLVLRGGSVIGPRGPRRADVAIEDGRISEIGEVARNGASEIDCTGCWVGPGLVDLHVHFREPGQEWKEDIRTGSLAAASGGFTAVVAMPNTDPPVDAGHLARYVRDKGEDVGLVEVVPAGSITLGQQGERLAHLDELWQAGVRVFTDDGRTVWDAGLLRRAMEYTGELEAVIAQHAEDPGLSRGGHMHEGSVSSRLGMPGIPAQAEEVIVARDLALVSMTGARYHVQHVSSAGTVRLIERAKEEGLPVTAEVTPHHLFFDEEALSTADPAYKMYPPLRRAHDRDALREAIVSGVIDAVASDHAPHAAHEVEVPFEEAPRGVTGLETAASAFVTSVRPDPVTFFRRLSVDPAGIAGLEDQGRWPEAGQAANLAVLDPDSEWVVETFQGRAGNSPFLGRTLRGRVRATLYGGRLTWGTPR